MTDRYHPIVVARYIGCYRAQDPKCWAIADREHANQTTGDERFDTYEQAKERADELNKRGDGQ